MNATLETIDGRPALRLERHLTIRCNECGEPSASRPSSNAGFPLPPTGSPWRARCSRWEVKPER